MPFDRKNFLKAIKSRQVDDALKLISLETTLSLFGCDLHQLTKNQWNTFFSVLMASQITGLDLCDNSLDQLTRELWKMFGMALAKSKVTRLDLRDNSIEKLIRKDGSAFYEMLITSAVTELEIGTDRIRYGEHSFLKLSEPEWMLFARAVGMSQVRILKLGELSWEQLDMRVFIGILESSHLTSLCFIRRHKDNVFSLTQEKWQMFGGALMRSHLTTLQLENFNIAEISEEQSQAFWGMIARSPLTTLHLSKDELNLTERSQKAFILGLANSQITTLRLCSVLHDHRSRKNFFTCIIACITKTHIIELDLINNFLGVLADKEWKELGAALEKSKVKRLNLGGNHLAELSGQEWQAFSRAKINAVIDLSDNGFDTVEGLKALLQHLMFAKATHLKIKLTVINNPLFLKQLVVERLTETLPIVSLDLSHRELTDDFIEGPLAYLLEHNLTSLEEINLSHNNLTLKSLKTLVALFSKYGWKNIKLLDLSNNYIEITSKEQLVSMNKQLLSAAEASINLTGNMVISPPYDAALLEVLRSLILRSQLTIRDFLKSTCGSISKVENEIPQRFVLTLKTKAERLVDISMNLMELQAFNPIMSDESMTLHEELIFYLTKKLYQRHIEMKGDLLDNPLIPYSEEEQKSRVKQLMDYHPNAPLCSKLITHSVFKSDHIDSVPSILFPGKKLTASQGMVYLAVKKDKLDQHTQLVYEWLTEYGQRFIRVAHLYVVGSTLFKSGHIEIEFIEKSPLAIKNYYLGDRVEYIIAGLEAAKDRLEIMHTRIQVENEHGVNATYKWMISSESSKREHKDITKKRVLNCCKWAIDHIQTDLGIKLNVDNDMLLMPLKLVSKLRDNPTELLDSSSKIAPKK